ncbi:hypothetical protein [Sphingomonas sp. MMS24-J13]|uniref:DUF7660 family protein n=1 Tax=Sphingomonas sp. MMS24-J13 TaxID=3238686 RepID=UPI00384A6E7B
MEHNKVHDQSSFADFIRRLRTELKDPVLAAKWENVTLADFLEGMEAWARDWKEPAQNNPWRHTADVLTAASIYE